MKKLVVTSAILALSLPLFASAEGAKLPPGFPFSNLDSFAAGLIANVHASSTTGGIVSGRAVSTGSSNASASIHNVIRGGGSTQVRVDIRTGSDGEVRDATIERTIQRGAREEIRLATSTKNSAINAFISVETRAPSIPRVPSEPNQPSFMRTRASTTPYVFRGMGSVFSDVFKRIFGR